MPIQLWLQMAPKSAGLETSPPLPWVTPRPGVYVVGSSHCSIAVDVRGRDRESLPHTLTPPAISFFPIRHGPKDCYTCLLGNLSPFTLDLRREKD